MNKKDLVILITVRILAVAVIFALGFVIGRATAPTSSDENDEPRRGGASTTQAVETTDEPGEITTPQTGEPTTEPENTAPVTPQPMTTEPPTLPTIDDNRISAQFNINNNEKDSNGNTVARVSVTVTNISGVMIEDGWSITIDVPEGATLREHNQEAGFKLEDNKLTITSGQNNSRLNPDASTGGISFVLVCKEDLVI